MPNKIDSIDFFISLGALEVPAGTTIATLSLVVVAAREPVGLKRSKLD